ncbi:MAG: hypothetical protein C5B59_18305 [Bacteroidetes bacterium]|nr:MAG: hypothetical protein C5B59_18305 [Bacteroidota bacterium]
MKRRYFLIIGICFLVLFYLWSLAVKKDKFHQLNFDTTVKLQDKIPKKFDSYWEDLTFFAEPGPSIVLMGVITLIAVVDVKKKKFTPQGLIIPLFFGLVVFAEIYGKAKVESPAPPFFMLKNPTSFFPKFFVQEQYSYPSGHAARSLFATIIGAYLVLRYSKQWQSLALYLCIFLSLCLLISFGKVYLGQHWLSDIIGGFLVALAFGSLAGIWLWPREISS